MFLLLWWRCSFLFYMFLLFYFFFFFFQAEDGIRDGTVTGVQTCALPIWISTPRLCELTLISTTPPRASRTLTPRFSATAVGYRPYMSPSAIEALVEQIGERRVGKECRSRGERYHIKKKHIHIYTSILLRR